MISLRKLLTGWLISIVNRKVFSSNRLYSRYVNVGLFYLRQLFFAKFDIKVHTDQSQYLCYLYTSPSVAELLTDWDISHTDACDYTALWNDLRTKLSLVKGSETPEPGQGMNPPTISELALIISNDRYLWTHNWWL